MVLLEGFSFKVYGLPAHPLIVHAVVVLLPLSALAFVTLMWRKQWREVYLIPVTVLALASAVAAFLAKETGESLEESVKETGKRLGEHPEQGDTAFILALVFGGMVLMTSILQTFGPTLRRRANLENRLQLPVSDAIAGYVLTVPVAIAAIVAIMIAGHSGATLVWKSL